MGARPLGRVIQEHIKKPLADEVLFGKLKHGGTVKVTVQKNELGEASLKLESVPDEAPVKPKKETPPKAKAKTADKPAASKAKSTKAAAKPASSPDKGDDKPGGARKSVPRVPRK